MKPDYTAKLADFLADMPVWVWRWYPRRLKTWLLFTVKDL